MTSLARFQEAGSQSKQHYSAQGSKTAKGVELLILTFSFYRVCQKWFEAFLQLFFWCYSHILFPSD